MRRLNKKVTVIIIIVFVISMIIWYRIPVKRSTSTTLCSLDGEQISVDFDLRWHKYIFKPTEIRGAIKLYNNTYYYINDTNQKMHFQVGIIENFIRKLNNNTNINMFIIPSNDPFNFHDNNIQLGYVDKNFETICIYVITDSNLKVYYGPAKTAEEAKLISLEINK